MPHGRDHRDRAAGDRAHHRFLVEGPEILDRSAAARDDDEIGARHRPIRRHGVKSAHGGGHLIGRALALHQHRPDDDAGGTAILQPVEDIADHGAGGRGDDADHARQERQRLLAIAIEQPFGRERPAPLVKELHQRALPGQLHPFDDDLIFGTARIGGEPAGGHHLDPVLRPEGEAAGGALPDHAVDHGLVVLQRQIAMAGGDPLEAGNLAAHADMAEPFLHAALERARKLGHAHRRRIVAGRLLG